MQTCTQKKPLTSDELQLQLRHTYRFEYKTNTQTPFPASGFTPNEILTQVKELMWRYANVQRNQKNLDLAISKIRNLKEHYHPWELLTSANCENQETVFQAEHFLTLSEAILLAMSERKESRGGHYRSDFPTLNPMYEKRFAIRLQNGQTIAEPSPCMDHE